MYMYVTYINRHYTTKALVYILLYMCIHVYVQCMYMYMYMCMYTLCRMNSILLYMYGMDKIHWVHCTCVELVAVEQYCFVFHYLHCTNVANFQAPEIITSTHKHGSTVSIMILKCAFTWTVHECMINVHKYAIYCSWKYWQNFYLVVKAIIGKYISDF